MALQASLQDLATRLTGLSDRLAELQVTVLQDSPSEIALADGLSGVVDDLQGWVQDSLDALSSTLGGAPQSDLESIVESVSRCRVALLEVLRRFSADLAAQHRLEQLTAVGRERGGDWGLWARGVKEAVDRCDAALQQALGALLGCYQEVAERVGAGSMSVQATAIGAEIRLGEDGIEGAHERSEPGRRTR